ncbi:hypothetical protein GLOIN_2v1475481 [Rhizophagus clarus]|uniref:Uncharacterized protein n=1 Tax=Rhizophagus clarus TaxID=94130 RepID=A0A8H3M822_9GLOM|nr:hypothetical protein GLOIN_2v1475481 [Rhizophagus clarus]
MLRLTLSESPAYCLINDNTSNMKAAWKILKQSIQKRFFLAVGSTYYTSTLTKRKIWKEIALILPCDTQYGSSYSCIDHLSNTKSAIQSTIAKDHLNLDDGTKSLIADDAFWNNLENFIFRTHVRNNTDLPELIRNAIGEFGSNRWQNFLYNPAVIVDYKLNPQYRGNHLNARTFDPIIEKEIIELAGEEYKYIVLTELGKTGDFVGNIIQNLLIGGI